MGARVYAVGARVYVSLVILVSAQVPLVLTLGLWTSGLGLTIQAKQTRNSHFTHYHKMVNATNRNNTRFLFTSSSCAELGRGLAGTPRMSPG